MKFAAAKLDAKFSTAISNQFAELPGEFTRILLVLEETLPVR